MLTECYGIMLTVNVLMPAKIMNSTDCGHSKTFRHPGTTGTVVNSVGCSVGVGVLSVLSPNGVLAKSLKNAKMKTYIETLDQHAV